MINFIKRHIILKILILTFISGGSTIGAAFILKKLDYQNISLNIFVFSLVIIISLYVLSFHIYVTWPLKNIIKQIKAILTGRKYNRIFTDKIDEIGIIAHFFNDTTTSIERASKDIKDQRRMSAELDVASKIQNDTFPQENPKLPGLTIITKTRPAVEIGGDSFDFITVKDNTFFYIGDVTGHGVPSGLVMMMINTLINTFCDLYDSTQQILCKTNRYLKPLLKSIMFMTISLFRWNHTARKLYFTGAGHQHILLKKNKNNALQVIRSGGLAIGMIQDIDKYITEVEINIEPGDFIFLYTDGIVECRNTAGEMFGMEKFKKLIEKFDPNETSEQIFNVLNAEISKFMEGTIQEDDMSIIIIKYKEETLSEEIQKNIHWELISDPKKSIIQY